ncbi:hypothetical protein WA158_005310 [Blastocystis sp. Blastoise]
MSQESSEFIYEKRKFDNLSSQSIEGDEISYINFIFQDERKISIPLSFLKKYSNSMLYKTYESSENYLEDENAYYIDSPFLSIDRLVDIICNSVSLDSLTFQELIDLNETLIHFLGNDSIDYQMTITDILIKLFLIFIKENNCKVDSEIDLYFRDNSVYMNIKDVFTKERNKLFLQYSYLFEYLNIVKVTLEYSFDDRIPYEYIYPSNLHEIFPKLEEYYIECCYYPLKNYIPIKPTDTHYIPLYKEYKRQYYRKYYPEAYCRYRDKHPEIEANILVARVHIQPMNNYGDNESIEEEEEENEENIHDEIIDIDIDEEIRNEKEEEKPDLYIESLSDYSREYNEEMIEKQKMDSPIDDKIIHSLYYFIFVDDNEIIDQQHPILCHNYDEYNDILLYILNLPICKQLKNIDIYGSDRIFLLQLETPPLLLLLKDSLYSSLEVFDFTKFISTRMYPEYIQLFKEIIKTHVFPNVTTLYIELETIYHYDINLLQDIISLITRDNFPKLHIYMFPFDTYHEEDVSLSKIYILIPFSLLNLMDTIQEKDHYSFECFLKNKNIHNHLITAKKQHSFSIKANISVDIFISTWKQLYDNGLLTIGTIKYIFSRMDYEPSDYSLIDLSVYPFKSLIIKIDSISYETLEHLENIYMNMNYKELQKFNIYFGKIYNREEYDVEFINKYLSFLCKGNYNNVTSLDIYDASETINDIDMYTLDTLLFQFFSLFSNNIKMLRTSDNNTSNHFELTSFFTFIKSFEMNSSISLPLLEKFTIELTLFEQTNYNVFKYFPSFSFYLHKPITSILTDNYLSECSKDNKQSYYNYIYNQLKQKYYEDDYSNYTLLLNRYKEKHNPNLKMKYYTHYHEIDYD